MITWFLNLFKRAKLEIYQEAHLAYDLSLSLADELDDQINAALHLTSVAQVQTEAKIDALIVELTKRKQTIMAGAKKAEKLQTIQAQLQSSMREVREALESVEDLGAAL